MKKTHLFSLIAAALMGVVMSSSAMASAAPPDPFTQPAAAAASTMKDDSMSFSFTTRAATKQQLKQNVSAELEKVVATQACHARDQQQIHAAASAHIDLLDDDVDKDVVVAVNGYLTGQWEGSDVTSIQGANLGVSAYLAERTPTTA